MTVVTDPHDGKSLGIAPPQVKGDLVLVSHDHFDHNAVSLVKGPNTSVISKPIMTVERGVRVEGMTAAHDANGGSKRGQITVFKFPTRLRRFLSSLLLYQSLLCHNTPAAIQWIKSAF